MLKMVIKLIHFLLALITVLNHVTAATPTISAVGSKFFTSDGNQFYIKGTCENTTSSTALCDLLILGLSFRHSIPADLH